MHRRDYQNQTDGYWRKISARLVYLPGALILAYGAWLTLTL